jgi:hypothetical protein
VTAVSQADFARDIGVARSRVTALKQAGRLVLDDKGRVMVEESKARIAETADPNRDDVARRHAANRASAGNAPSAPAAPETDRVGSSYQQARAVKEKFLALSAKRDYEIACSKLMQAEEVVSAIASAAVTLRTRLEAWPDTMAAMLGGNQDETQRRAILADGVEELLAGLTAEFNRIAKPEL